MKNKSIDEILCSTKLWGADICDMAEIVKLSYEKIETLGAKGAMEWILSE